MRIELKKQPEKYLDKCTQDDYDKIYNALVKLENLQGDIKKLQGRKDEYRVKIPPYRIIFTYDKVRKVIIVTRIDTRGDVYKKG
jgi:mRNA-degrading endonuclease RelE of RelBE toxin-antitoxin system